MPEYEVYTSRLILIAEDYYSIYLHHKWVALRNTATIVMIYFFAVLFIWFNVYNSLNTLCVTAAAKNNKPYNMRCITPTAINYKLSTICCITPRAITYIPFRVFYISAAVLNNKIFNMCYITPTALNNEPFNAFCTAGAINNKPFTYVALLLQPNNWLYSMFTAHRKSKNDLGLWVHQYVYTRVLVCIRMFLLVVGGALVLHLRITTWIQWISKAQASNRVCPSSPPLKYTASFYIAIPL